MLHKVKEYNIKYSFFFLSQNKRVGGKNFGALSINGQHHREKC